LPTGKPSRKRLFCIALADAATNPFSELGLRALARDGWDITFAAPNAANSVMARALDYPCRRRGIEDAGASRWKQELSVQRCLQEARFGRYDVIYLLSQALSVRAAFGLAGPLFGKRLVYHTFDFYDPAAYPYHARFERHIARRAAAFLNGEFHRAYFCRSLYRLRCPVCLAPPNLPSDWPIPPRSGAIRKRLGARHPGDILLMLIGGRSPKRATDEILAALALLPQRFRLAMTTEPSPELEQILTRLGVKERVTCLGRLDYLDLFSYVSSADIGVMLHVNSDLGNFFQQPGRLTEYLACGLPVLASNFTGLQLLLSRHGVGVTVDPGSPESIACGLLELESGLGDGRYGRSLIRRRFEESFAFDHWEQRIQDVFAGVLESRQGTASIGPPDVLSLAAPMYASGEAPARLASGSDEVATKVLQ